MTTPLQIPAMRGVIGNWIYYVALLPFSEVSSRIKKTEEIHSSVLLRQMIQRALTPRSKTIWDTLAGAIPELQKVQDLDILKPLPESYRSAKGGDLLFRAIAPPMIVRCLRRAATLGMEEAVFIKRFSKIPRSLNKAPWLGLLWDGTNMIVGEKNQKLAESLILWMVNCDPGENKIQAAGLKKKLALVLNKASDQCQLPPKVS